MKLLAVTPRYLPALGGAEIHLHELSRRFVRVGDSVTVLTLAADRIEGLWDPHLPHLEAGESQLDGVHIIRCRLDFLPLAPRSYHALRRLLWLLSPLPGIPLALLQRLAGAAPRSRRLEAWLAAQAGAYDLILGVNIGYEGFHIQAQMAAQRARLPFVSLPFTHLGAGEQPGSDGLGRFYTMRQQVASVAASHLLLAESASEAAFYQAAGLPAERALVAGSAVNPGELDGGDPHSWHSGPEPLVLMLSRLSVDKGALTLIAAAERLWAAGVSFRLVLAGPTADDFEAAWQQLAADTRRRVELVGEVRGQRKRDLLAAADVFVMPSRVDSFGIVYLEAWLYETPVIGAQTWGVSDLITDGEDGFLIPFGDAAALAEKIERLFEPHLAARLGANGRRKVLQRYTWEKQFALVQSALYQLLPEGKG